MGVGERVRGEVWEWVTGEEGDCFVPYSVQLRVPWVPASVHGQKEHAAVGSQALQSQLEG